MFYGIAGVGSDGVPATEVVAGPTTIDLSGLAVESDTDSIINTVTSTTITLNKSGTGLGVPARFHLSELAAGETVTVTVKRGAVTGGSKVALFVGIKSDSGQYGAGINAHGSGVPQTINWNGTSVGFVGLRTTEDTTVLTFVRLGSNVEIRNAPIHYQQGGTTITNGTAATNVAVTGTVYLSLWVSINDNTGGTVAIPYSGSYSVQPAP